MIFPSTDRAVSSGANQAKRSAAPAALRCIVSIETAGDSRVQVVRVAAFSASPTNEEMSMKWIDPAYCDIRLGFEVTAYVYVR